MSAVLPGPSGDFEVIPAIDLRGGRLGRMPGGDPAALCDVPGEPLALAERLVAEGARWIHLVDLDAALTGRPSPDHLDLLEAVAGLGVPVQAGGSLTPEAAAAALGRGASRAVLGAGTLFDPEGLRLALAADPGRLGVAIDVRDGVVAPRGSARRGPDLQEALALLAGLRPAFVTYTAVPRDGAAAGPDLAGLAVAAAEVGVPVLASGGVRSPADLRAVALAHPLVAGAIVGRALQDGAFTVREAVDAVRSVRPSRSQAGM